MSAHPVILLSIVTLIAVLAIGFWQLRSVRGSQAKRGETPGETTITAKAEAPPPALPEMPVAKAGDTTNVKHHAETAARQDARGLNAMSKQPVHEDARIRS